MHSFKCVNIDKSLSTKVYMYLAHPLHEVDEVVCLVNEEELES